MYTMYWNWGQHSVYSTLSMTTYHQSTNRLAKGEMFAEFCFKFSLDNRWHQIHESHHQIEHCTRQTVQNPVCIQHWIQYQIKNLCHVPVWLASQVMAFVAFVCFAVASPPVYMAAMAMELLVTLALLLLYLLKLHRKFTLFFWPLVVRSHQRVHTGPAPHSISSLFLLSILWKGLLNEPPKCIQLSSMNKWSIHKENSTLNAKRVWSDDHDVFCWSPRQSQDVFNSVVAACIVLVLSLMAVSTYTVRGMLAGGVRAINCSFSQLVILSHTHSRIR